MVGMEWFESCVYRRYSTVLFGLFELCVRWSCWCTGRSPCTSAPPRGHQYVADCLLMLIGIRRSTCLCATCCTDRLRRLLTIPNNPNNPSYFRSVWLLMSCLELASAVAEAVQPSPSLSANLPEIFKSVQVSFESPVGLFWRPSVHYSLEGSGSVTSSKGTLQIFICWTVPPDPL